MKTEKNILIAFILNLVFSMLEFMGGAFTGSIAIVSDAVHDIGDAISIGVSYFLEKKSKKAPDEVYTYGYGRYSVIGGAITTIILLVGSVVVIINSIGRIIEPVEISYNGMIIFAVIGVCVNLVAAFYTHKGESLNQRAVNLHMIEDVLGWIVVLTGAIVMRFTRIQIIDPIMSIGVSSFIFFNAVSNLKEIADIFLEKAPDTINTRKIKEDILRTDGVICVHNLHIWRIDSQDIYATMHIVTNFDFARIKKNVRTELLKYGISHTTLEFETTEEDCHETSCSVQFNKSAVVNHHH